MLPILEVESFYRNSRDTDYLRKDAFRPAALLCKRWLLDLGETPSGFEDAREALQKARNELHPDDRMHFAIAMALCFPCPNIPTFFERHKDYIRENSFEIGTYVVQMSRDAHLQDRVDVLACFEALGCKDYLQAACEVYRVQLDEVRFHAMACDNLGLFQLTLPQFPQSSEWNWSIFEAIAKFPDNPTSSIFKHYVSDEQGEKNLFSRRLLNTKTRLIGNWSARPGLLPMPGSRIPTLHPGYDSQLQSADLNDIPDAHRDPKFAPKVQADRHRLVAEFFCFSDDSNEAIDLAHAKEITQAFLNAGISGDFIINHGVFERSESDPKVTLKSALKKLTEMSPAVLEFYTLVYRSYLANFPVDRIIAAADDNSLVHLYKITADKAFLAAASDLARERCFGSDLGL